MIIHKGYDVALWCILSADKKNRPKIVEFIKSIPQELLTKINDGILQLKKHEQNESDKGFDLYDSVDVDEDTCFSFQLTDDGTLRLSKNVRDKNDWNLPYDSVFEIVLLDCLCCLDKEYFQNFDEEWLGTIETDTEVKSFFTCNEREYYLIKTPVGHLVAYNRENALIVKAFGRFINLNKMPDDLNMSDLDKFNKQKLLKK